jgi:mycofactocin precursor
VSEPSRSATEAVEATDTESAVAGAAEPTGTAVVEEDLLIEEVSIDGMCGVY